MELWEDTAEKLPDFSTLKQYIQNYYCDGPNLLNNRHKPEENIAITFSCLVCKLTFDSIDELCRHLPTHYKAAETAANTATITKYDGNLDDEECDSTDNDGNSFPECHQCLWCLRQFHNREQLHSHLIDAGDTQGDAGWTCSTCGHASHTRCGLYNHMQERHSIEKRYECPICGSRFTRRYNLSAHMRHHDNTATRHQCPVCARTYAQRSSLRLHMHAHSCRQRYVCSQCGYQSARRCNLELHVLTHTGTRPHACLLCDKRFTRKWNLKVHLNKHLAR